MSLVVRAQLRFLWRARASMLSALLGMTIGVASITGVHLLSAQIAEQVRRQVEPVSQVDLYLTRPELGEDDYFALRETWRAGMQPKVAAVFPLLEGTVTFAEQTLLLTGTDPLALGSAANAGAGSRAASFAADGAPGSAHYLLVDSVYLAPSMRDHAEVGATIILGNAPVLVLGHSAPEGVVLADLPTARRVLQSAGLSRIGVVLTAEARRARGFTRLANFFDRLFPGAIPVRAVQPLEALAESTGHDHWTQVSALSASPVVQLLQSVLFNVAMLSLLALVVAWLLTYQVACHALGRRQAMFARLQSLGVARQRLRRLTLVEGVALGLLATVLGSLLGVWLANLLFSLMLGADFAWVLGVDRFVLLKALASGVGVAGLSYWLAARDDIFANNQIQMVLPRQEDSRADVLWLVGLVGVFLCGWLLPATGLPGAFASILCCALVLIVFLPRLAAFAWRSTLAPPGITGTAVQHRPLKLLGRRQVLVGQELRLGISALTLALAAALGISIMVDSFRGAFVEMLDRRLADAAVLVLQEPASEPMRAKLELDAATTLVGPVVWRGVVPVRSNGVGGRLEFAEHFDALLQRFVPAEEMPADLSGGVFVNESYARKQDGEGIRPGQTLTLAGQSGTQQVVVKGIFSDYGELRPRLLGSAALVERITAATPYTEAYVNTQDLAALRKQLAGWIADAGLQVRDQGQVRTRSLEIFEQTFAITRALTWLALLVAVVALGNALAAHALQLAGADRQLQVLGVSQAAARRLRVQRILYAAGVALLLALPHGLAIAALLCGVVNPRAFGWSFALQITWSGVGWPLLGGIFGGLLGGVLGSLFSGNLGSLLSQSLGQGRSRGQAIAPVLFAGVLLGGLIGCGEQTSGRAFSSPAANQSTPGLRVGNLLGGSTDDFERAREVREFEFPRDHGAHPTFRSEWWYLTCPLRSSAAGPDAAPDYGVQFTLFRQALSASMQGTAGADLWRSGQVYMAHSALTSVSAGQHLESSRFARGHPRMAGVRAEPFAAWLENWRIDATPPGGYSLAVNAPEFSVALELQTQKPLVLQGDRGLSYKGSTEASYYYSLPRLGAHGQVSSGAGQMVEVTGACWFDREWSTSVLAEGLTGWDWFALQFDDNTELMLFQLRADTNVPGEAQLQGEALGALNNLNRRQGKAIAVSGAATTLAPGELEFAVLRYWRDEAGIDWPVEWRVRVSDRVLRVVAALDDQRMRETIDYWEGLVWVFEGKTRIGQGYLEMTGYSGPVQLTQLAH